MRYPIPQTSAKAWQDFLKEGQNDLAEEREVKPKNVGLLFDRFVQQDWRRNPEKDAKKTTLQQVISFEDTNGHAVPHKTDEFLLNGWIARWTEITQKGNATPFTMKTDWRFVTGLGRKGPLETGFTFHRYGFPILPGSSVKGLARTYAFYWLDKQVWKNEQINESNLQLLTEILEDDNDEAFEKKFREAYANTNPEIGHNLRSIFGTKINSGKAIFFDAIPAHVPELKLDILNPHYPNYYQGDEYPADWQNPIPSYFLTVAPEQAFLFAVGWRGKFDNATQKRLDMAVNVLKRALEQLGAGAKTSAGYGYFKPAA